MATSTSQMEKAWDDRLSPWQSIRWNISRALIVTRREVIDMFRDWRIIAPIVILTLVFPSIANWGAEQMMNWVEQYGADIVADRLVPFLLLIVGFFPTSFSLIIALESFVGEKERRSLEPLLSTPLSDLQLYLGKTLASAVPPLVGSLLGVTVYLVSVYFNLSWSPPLVLLVQVFALTIIQALVMVSGAVVVSSQVTSVRAANLLASFIIVPVGFLIQAEAFIMFWGYYDALWWIILGLATLYVVLVRMGIRNFNREDLLGHEIDELHLGKGIKRLYHLTLARREGGPRRSVWQWYREEILNVIWQSRIPIVLLAVAIVAGYFIGGRFGNIYELPGLSTLDGGDWYTSFQSVLYQIGFNSPRGILLIAGQNIRALFIASVLAVFSLGVLAVLILMIPFILIGYIGVQMNTAGLGANVLAAAVLPHSFLEIPAVLIAGALAIRLGASVLAPRPGEGISGNWLRAFADAIRVWWLLILPLLVAAAAVEIYLTPVFVGLTAVGG